MAKVLNNITFVTEHYIEYYDLEYAELMDLGDGLDDGSPSRHGIIDMSSAGTSQAPNAEPYFDHDGFLDGEYIDDESGGGAGLSPIVTSFGYTATFDPSIRSEIFSRSPARAFGTWRPCLDSAAPWLGNATSNHGNANLDDDDSSDVSSDISTPSIVGVSWRHIGDNWNESSRFEAEVLGSFKK